MLGARSIGTRWLGSGRSQLPDYTELSATLTVVGSFSGPADRGFALGGTMSTSAGLSGAVVRRRGLSASLEVVGGMDGGAGRNRALSGRLEAQTDLSGPAGRQRPLSGRLSAGTDLSGLAGRQRSLGGKLTTLTSLQGKTTRRRGLSATLTALTGLSGITAVGKSLAGRLETTFQAGFGRLRDFFPPSQAGRFIRVDPKDRDLPVQEKDRVIEFIGDDEVLNMEERVKQPAEVVDYTIDMRRWFASISGDFIPDTAGSVELSVDIEGDAEDLEFGPGSLPNWVPVGDPAHMAKIWIGGGRDGVDYQVTAKVTTDRGRVEKVDFIIRVERQAQ